MFSQNSNLLVIWRHVRASVTVAGVWARQFWRAHWRGTIAIIAVTILFFWPVIVRVSSYSEGGDMLFNAWVLARDQHCILRQGCPNYLDANIFFPHKDSMLYSETQLSAGLLTLPLSWINHNPVFSYNVWTILSFFFSGWFMYLLAKRLSRGNELISIVAGLIFEFAPAKLSSVTHMQNLSIFYLPLAVLCVWRYMDSARKRYLVGLFVALALLFYASWYQMVFALVALGLVIGLLWLFKRLSSRSTVMLVAAVTAAVIVTAPLALQYVRFSRQNNATFHLGDQLLYSSSIADYLIPHQWSGLGKFLVALAPKVFADRGSPGNFLPVFNKDGYSFAGFTLYVVAVALVVVGVRWYWQAFRRRPRKDTARRTELLGYALIFGSIVVVGFFMSLGPFLQLKGHYSYGQAADYRIVIPAPWLLADKFLPQLQFIRAIGRASILVLFGLCCLLALLPQYLASSRLAPKRQGLILLGVSALALFELMPLHQALMRPWPPAYDMQIPKVYRFIQAHPEVNDLIVLRSLGDYQWQGHDMPIPMATPQDVLWAGYTNRNIFNGYSGYTPPGYQEQYADFVDLQPDDIGKMKALGLEYVLVDKELSPPPSPLVSQAAQLFTDKVYEDARYALYRLPS